MQPTQSIQSIRYMPQYLISLVNEMNVLNECKILETYWSDWIGCTGSIHWIVWIDCKSIQLMQPIQSNQPIQYSLWTHWIGWIYLDTLTSTWFDLIRCAPLGAHLCALVLRRPDARWSPNPPMKPRKRPARALAVDGVEGHHKRTRAPFDSTPTKQNATLPGPGPGLTSIQSIEPIHEIPNLIIRFII
jgi:hypothetical protein